MTDAATVSTDLGVLGANGWEAPASPTARESSTNAEPTIDDGAAFAIEQGQIGGERNTSSTTNNYDATKHECNSSVLSAGTGAKNIGAAGTTPIFLMGIYANAALVGTLTITGFTAEDGVTAANLVIPIGASGWLLAPGNARRCETGCTVAKSSASDDGKILIDWRPI